MHGALFQIILFRDLLRHGVIVRSGRDPRRDPEDLGHEQLKATDQSRGRPSGDDATDHARLGDVRAEAGGGYRPRAGSIPGGRRGSLTGWAGKMDIEATTIKPSTASGMSTAKPGGPHRDAAEFVHVPERDATAATAASRKRWMRWTDRVRSVSTANHLCASRRRVVRAKGCAIGSPPPTT